MKLRTVAQSISWKDAVIGALLGAIVGVVFSAALSPYVISFVNDQYMKAGAPGYEPPPVKTELSKEDVWYPNGTEVPEFGNLTWKNEYEVYHLLIKNEGNKVARDVEVYSPLPGCIHYVNKDGAGAGGDFNTREIVSVREQGGDPSKNPVRELSCSKFITTDYLDPGDSIGVEFIVTDRFNRCDFLIGLHLRSEIVTTYRWEKAGSYYSTRRSHPQNHLENEYNEVAKRIEQQGTVKFVNSYHNRKYAVAIMANGDTLKEAGQKCGVHV